jgi:hypothetical protein
VHFTGEYVFFPVSASSLFETSYQIMTIAQRTQEHEENPISGAGKEPQKKKCFQDSIDDNVFP